MRRGIVAVLLVVLVPGSASAGPGTLDQLRERVAEARRLASEGEAAPSEAAMDRVRAAMGLPGVVVVLGRPVPVPADPYLARLRGASAEEFRAAGRHLDALSSRLEAVRPPVDRAELRADLRAAYGTRSATDRSFADRIQEAIGSFLSWLGRESDRALGGIPGLVLLALVVGVGVLLLLRRRAFSMVPEGGAAAERRGSPADWRRLAGEARARGDLAEAVACLYRAVVSELAARGVVDDHPSLTAREIRLATALSLRLAAPIAEASRRYEGVRYGGQPPTDDDVASLERAERAARAR